MVQRRMIYENNFTDIENGYNIRYHFQKYLKPYIIYQKILDIGYLYKYQVFKSKI